MKEFLLWIALTALLIFGSIEAIKGTQGPNPANIGPHETVYVSGGYYLTLPKANITITGTDFFVITNQDTKLEIYPVFVPPSIGEDSFHFVTTNPPEGKYKVTYSSIALYSETPTSIVTQDNEFDRGLKTGTIVFLSLCLFVLGSAKIYHIF